jgi:hypothetical protein
MREIEKLTKTLHEKLKNILVELLIDLIEFYNN